MKTELAEPESGNRFLHKKDSCTEPDTKNLLTHGTHNQQDFYVKIDFEDFMRSKPQFSIKDETSDVGPVGLFGFGLTTILLSLSNSEVYPVSSVVFSMGALVGGLAQIIAGFFEWYKNKFFTAIVFLLYGFFWMSFVLIMILPAMGLAPPPDDVGLGTYLFLWAIISAAFTLAAIKRSPQVVILVFITAVITLVLLAVLNWTNNVKTGKVAGAIGTICGILAVYCGIAELVNMAWGFTIFPLEFVKREQKKI